MHHDGSLVLHNTSTLHSGLYYCLLQHTDGTTLWPYQLQVSHDNKEYSKYEQHSSCGAFRFRRDVGSDAERQDVVSDGQFAGAVAASVLLTFVFGFSAGALSRTHVLRCIQGPHIQILIHTGIRFPPNILLNHTAKVVINCSKQDVNSLIQLSSAAGAFLCVLEEIV